MPETEMSRFPIHDDLTAPDGSLPILKGASSAAGQFPTSSASWPGGAAALKAVIPALPRRIAPRLAAAAQRRADRPRGSGALRLQTGLQLHQRTSRQAGGIDQVARAKRWDSGDAREAALLRYLRPLLGDRANFPQHLHEEAREAGGSDQQLLEAIAVLSLETFTAMVNVAGDIPIHGSVEETRVFGAERQPTR